MTETWRPSWEIHAWLAGLVSHFLPLKKTVKVRGHQQVGCGTDLITPVMIMRMKAGRQELFNGPRALKSHVT